jgi:hypothetical protein
VFPIILFLLYEDNSGNMLHVQVVFMFSCILQSLSTVELNSSSLASLSLAGCRAMTFLRLSCLNLQNVNLDGCDHLEEASFCPVSLLWFVPEMQYICFELCVSLFAHNNYHFVLFSWKNMVMHVVVQNLYDTTL